MTELTLFDLPAVTTPAEAAALALVDEQRYARLDTGQTVWIGSNWSFLGLPDGHAEALDQLVDDGALVLGRKVRVLLADTRRDARLWRRPL